MTVYKTEGGVGEAIRESGLKREELFITTKYDGGDIREAIEGSLKKVCPMGCGLFFTLR